MKIDFQKLEDLTFAVQEEMANDESIDLLDFHWQFERMEYQLEMVKSNVELLMRIFGVDEE